MSEKWRQKGLLMDIFFFVGGNTAEFSSGAQFKHLFNLVFFRNPKKHLKKEHMNTGKRFDEFIFFHLVCVCAPSVFRDILCL